MSSHIDYVIKVLMESKSNSNYVEINLPQDLLCRVVSEATELIMSQPMLLELTAPLNICGDIHGIAFSIVQTFRTVFFLLFR